MAWPLLRRRASSALACSGGALGSAARADNTKRTIPGEDSDRSAEGLWRERAFSAGASARPELVATWALLGGCAGSAERLARCVGPAGESLAPCDLAVADSALRAPLAAESSSRVC